ncbi:type II secretion system protein [Roseateles toxinivorans]|uniref:Prepilin-type N-terminal cleavage/methylation domain-containing protein n=1 Tax=Roseateles toxinivorans TaxID=270368 RepID=A0A4R6QMQ8_9BURK|nr:type II secretion system protein [Roseateles toxinivorans]TDP71426.1 prepilin-type N-terminal cleavage/methylation domain-containing protein [Roseateles toxinivorans]
MPLRAHQRGISLLEVIVALVILSSFGAALFVWAGQTLQIATRAQVLQQEAELERNVSEHAASINPAATSEGRLDTPTHRFAWKATAILGPVDHVRHPQGLSPYQVGLYKLSYIVTENDTNKVVLTSEREAAGFLQVRPRGSGGPMGFGL